MRKADFDVAWKECRRESRKRLSILRVATAGSDVTDFQEIGSRITCFVGPNGVGKTRFLKDLAGFLGDANFQPKLNSVVAVIGAFNGRQFITAAGKGLPDQLVVEYLDSSKEAHKLKTYFADRSKFENSLSDYEPNISTVNLLGLYKHVAKRNYSAVKVYEVEAPASAQIQDGESEIEDKHLPFFEVAVNGQTYGSTEMGFGELCACLLVWKVSRAPKGSVLIFDEPDSHLSPLSRSSLLDMFAYLAHDRELWIGFATHAIELTETLKESEIFLISQNNSFERLLIAGVEKRRNVTRSLGLMQRRKLLVAVEDIDAHAALWIMFSRYAEDLSAAVEISIVKDGASDLISFVEKFPQNNRICHAIGVLDGDKRDSKIAPHATVFFLPGDADPIAAARSIVTASCSGLATALSVDAVRLASTVNAISHIDHHDFIASLIDAHPLEGRSVQQVRMALLAVWLDDPVVAQAAFQLLTTQIIPEIDKIPL